MGKMRRGAAALCCCFCHRIKVKGGEREGNICTPSSSRNIVTMVTYCTGITPLVPLEPGAGSERAFISAVYSRVGGRV